MRYRRLSGSNKSAVSITMRIGLTTLVVLVAVAINLILRSPFTKEKAISQKSQIAFVEEEIREPPDASSEMAGIYCGLCKKNSVSSVEDLRRTMQNDPVLSAHFSGFCWEVAKLGTLDKDTWTYVSYRKGDIIRRTSKQVRLFKGDRYVTDGVYFVRTYCCNDYVNAPPPATSVLVPVPSDVYVTPEPVPEPELGSDITEPGLVTPEPEPELPHTGSISYVHRPGSFWYGSILYGEVPISYGPVPSSSPSTTI